MRPKIVTLCGSTRFRREFEDAARSETLKGNAVFSVGVFGHNGDNDLDDEVKKRLDALHLAKVAMADEILVINGLRPRCGTCGRWCIRPYDGDISPCCGKKAGGGPVGWLPYVGDSTRGEIAHARRLGKHVRFINPEH